MAKVIYQPTAGRLRIGGKDYSLEDLVMTYFPSNQGDYLITIKSGVHPTNVKNTVLSEIEDDVGGTYANIAAWIAWWDALEFGMEVEAVVTGGATSVKQDSLLTEAQTLRGKQFPNVGIHVLTGTGAAPAGTYTGFLVLEDVVISAITLSEAEKVTGTNDFSGIILIAGTFIEVPGGFTTITLTSGSMILIKSA